MPAGGVHSLTRISIMRVFYGTVVAVFLFFLLGTGNLKASKKTRMSASSSYVRISRKFSG